MRYKVKIGRFEQTNYCPSCKRASRRADEFRFVSNSARQSGNMKPLSLAINEREILCPHCGEYGMDAKAVGRYVSIEQFRFRFFPLDDFLTFFVPKGSDLVVITTTGVDVVRNGAVYHSRAKPDFKVLTHEEAEERIEEQEHGYGG